MAQASLAHLFSVSWLKPSDLVVGHDGVGFSDLLFTVNLVVEGTLVHICVSMNRAVQAAAAALEPG